MKMAGSYGFLEENDGDPDVFTTFLTQDLGAGTKKHCGDHGRCSHWMFFWCCGICRAPLMEQGKDFDRDPR